MNKIPDDIKRKIYDYDDTYKHFFDYVIQEYMILFEKYDNLFYKYHIINQNVKNKNEYIKKWICEYGVNYIPSKWILNYNKKKFFRLVE